MKKHPDSCIICGEQAIKFEPPVVSNPDLLQFNPNLLQFNPNLLQFNPDLLQFNPDLSQLNPNLSQLNPNMLQLNLNLSQLNPTFQYYCEGKCGGLRIRRNAFYYSTTNNLHHWCVPCFGDLKDPILLPEGPLSKKVFFDFFFLLFFPLHLPFIKGTRLE